MRCGSREDEDEVREARISHGHDGEAIHFLVDSSLQQGAMES